MSLVTCEVCGYDKNIRQHRASSLLLCPRHNGKLNSWMLIAEAHDKPVEWAIEKCIMEHAIGTKVKKEKHVHKYRNIKKNNKNFWCCALPDCTHSQPTYLNDALLGRKSICWQCEKEMTLDDVNMQMDKPICHICAHPIATQLENEGKDIDDFLSDLLK